MSTKKKAKRNKKKSKAPPPSVPSPLDAMAELSLSSTTTTTAATYVCYHGSTAEKFFPGSDYGKYIQDHLDFCNEMLERNGSISVNAVRLRHKTEYELMKDLPHLDSYVFAWCTNVFLKFDDHVSQKVAKLVLIHAIHMKYIWVPKSQGKYVGDGSIYADKFLKYNRAVRADDRGIINCLARETKDFCDCMKQKKVEAHDMVKRGRCDGCWGLFPKDQLLECKGCHVDRYHSKECQTNDWPKHRLRCKAVQENQKKLAANEE